MKDIMKLIGDLSVNFCCGYEHGQEVKGFVILKGVPGDEKVMGFIPYEEIGSWERYDTMEEQELEKLVDKNQISNWKLHKVPQSQTNPKRYYWWEDFGTPQGLW